MKSRSDILKGLMKSNAFLTATSLITGKSKHELLNAQRRLLGSFGANQLDLAIASAGAFKRLKFVQVGANDGKTGDPIHNAVLAYADSALLIEPQSWLIDGLRSNYSSFAGNLVIENIAIGTAPGEMELHILDEVHWPEYIKRTGRHPSPIFSPCREQVLRRVSARLELDSESVEAAVIPVPVPVEPLSSLLEKHDFTDVDILQIDCEGWDYEVIKSLGDVRPPIINFESANLSETDWNSFVDWSIQNGYGYIRTGMDTLALRNYETRPTV